MTVSSVAAWRQRLRQRQPERVAQAVASARQIAAQQERRHRRVGDRSSRATASTARAAISSSSAIRGSCNAAIIMTEMILVRYATLVALVLWLGVMVDDRFGDLLRQAHLISYGCGAATLVGLFVLKFMGPPPAAFVLRAGIAILMLALLSPPRSSRRATSPTSC